MREGTSPPLRFIAVFTSHRSPLSERLEQVRPALNGKTLDNNRTSTRLWRSAVLVKTRKRYSQEDFSRD